MIPVCVDGFIVQIIFGENVEMQKKTIYYNIDQQEDAKSKPKCMFVFNVCTYVMYLHEQNDHIKQHYNQRTSNI